MARTHGWKLMQFSLRTTLVFTLLVAVYISYLVQLETDRRQLVQEIKDAGGKVTVDETVLSIFSTERITAVSLPHDCIHEIGARRLMALPKLSTLSLTDVEVSSDNGTRLRAAELQLRNISKALLESIDAKQNLIGEP